MKTLKRMETPPAGNYVGALARSNRLKPVICSGQFVEGIEANIDSLQRGMIYLIEKRSEIIAGVYSSRKGKCLVFAYLHPKIERFRVLKSSIKFIYRIEFVGNRVSPVEL